MEKKTSTITTK